MATGAITVATDIEVLLEVPLPAERPSPVGRPSPAEMPPPVVMEGASKTGLVFSVATAVVATSTVGISLAVGLTILRRAR